MLTLAILYFAGLASLLATFLPFSPLTIDIINLSRGAQLAIYRLRHLLWGVTASAWAVALILGLQGAGEPMLGAGTVVGIVMATAALMGLMFWTGYVPVVMSPPSRTRRLEGAAAAARAAADDMVLGVDLDGEACAYLRDQIARPHYFVDRVGSRDIVISYCILCNSATAFEATLAGRSLDLHCVTAFNNNIIYRDRASGNFIQQIDAQVIAGPDTGKRLATIPVTITRWSDWLALHPHTALLDAPPQTWRDRLVALMLEVLIPIHRLARRERPWHRVQGALDPRLGAMQFVLGVEIGGDAVAYSVEELQRRGVVEDSIGSTPVVVLSTRDAAITGVYERALDSRVLTFAPVPATAANGTDIARDLETGSTWSVSGRATGGPLQGSQLRAVPHFNKLFWFSWALFKPRVRLYVPPTAGSPGANAAQPGSEGRCLGGCRQ